MPSLNKYKNSHIEGISKKIQNVLKMYLNFLLFNLSILFKNIQCTIRYLQYVVYALYTNNYIKNITFSSFLHPVLTSHCFYLSYYAQNVVQYCLMQLRFQIRWHIFSVTCGILRLVKIPFFSQIKENSKSMAG
jgi:hypothetical protein